MESLAATGGVAHKELIFVSIAAAGLALDLIELAAVMIQEIDGAAASAVVNVVEPQTFIRARHGALYRAPNSSEPVDRLECGLAQRTRSAYGSPFRDAT